jgi:hypothetical protein
VASAFIRRIRHSGLKPKVRADIGSKLLLNRNQRYDQFELEAIRSFGAAPRQRPAPWHNEGAFVMHFRSYRSLSRAFVLGVLLAGLVLPTATSAQDVPLYPTRDGNLSELVLHEKLAAAGYPGPWDIGSMLGAYERAAPPPPTYATRNGPRTAAQLQTEVASIGYTGPWDIQSMLGAYERAAPQATTVATAPAQPNFERECERYAASLPGQIGNRILLHSNIVLICTSYAARYGAVGVACVQSVLAREFADAVFHSRADLDTFVGNCVTGR